MHTPGPWEWKWEEKDLGWMNPGKSPTLRGPDGRAIIEGFSPYEDGGIRSDYPQNVAEANANLIEAAPELLAGCKAFIEWADSSWGSWAINSESTPKALAQYNAAKAAIAKAEAKEMITSTQSTSVEGTDFQ